MQNTLIVIFTVLSLLTEPAEATESSARKPMSYVKNYDNKSLLTIAIPSDYHYFFPQSMILNQDILHQNLCSATFPMCLYTHFYCYQSKLHWVIVQQFCLSGIPDDLITKGSRLFVSGCSWEHLLLPKVLLMCYIGLSSLHPLLQSLAPTKIAPPLEWPCSHSCPHLPSPERLL